MFSYNFYFRFLVLNFFKTMISNNSGERYMNPNLEIIDSKIPTTPQPNLQWPQWNEEDVERNFVLVRKILRRLNFRIRVVTGEFLLQNISNYVVYSELDFNKTLSRRSVV